MTLFIPGNVPSSKNGKVWTGKFLVSSATHRRYEKATLMLYKHLAPQFRELTKALPKPLHVHFRFVRDTKRKFDYINPAQTVQDFMVKTGWIDDDNTEEIIPYFDQCSVDPKSPGVYITF